MATIFIAPNNDELKRLIEQLNRVAGMNIQTREVLMVIAENGGGVS